MLIGFRSSCRLRAGLVSLRHAGGRQSRSRYQQCVLCGKVIRNALVHVLGKCEVISAERSIFLSLCGSPDLVPQDVAVRVSGCPATSCAFEAAVAIAAQLDKLSIAFWSSR